MSAHTQCVFLIFIHYQGVKRPVCLIKRFTRSKGRKIGITCLYHLFSKRSLMKNHVIKESRKEKFFFVVGQLRGGQGG